MLTLSNMKEDDPEVRSPAGWSKCKHSTDSPHCRCISFTEQQ